MKDSGIDQQEAEATPLSNEHKDESEELPTSLEARSVSVIPA